MKKVIKLNESDLTKLVKRIIKENLNEGIRPSFDIAEYLQTNNPSSEFEYYITAEPNKSLKFTAVKNPNNIFYIDDNFCTRNETNIRISNYIDRAYGEALYIKHDMIKRTSKIINPNQEKTQKKEYDDFHQQWEAENEGQLKDLKDLERTASEEISNYVRSNKLYSLTQLWYDIDTLDSPNTIFKVKIIRNVATAPPSITDFGAITNLGKKLPDGKLNMKDPLQNNIISYFFNTNMLQISSPNKVYKLYSMCTAKPV